MSRRREHSVLPALRDPVRATKSAALILLFLSGCSEEGWDLPPIAYESTRVRMGLGGSFAHHELCPADLDRLDRRVEFVEARLGIRRDVPITVYMLDADGWGPPQCPEGAMGCYFAKEDHAFSSYWFAVDHEMVHAVTRDIPFPSNFWNEGTAEMLAGNWTKKDPTFVLTSNGLEANELANYLTAAHFCRYLVETRGWEKFAQAIRGEELASVYGESAEMLVAAYEREAPDSYPPFEPCPYPAILQPDDESWGETLSLTCVDPSATGMSYWTPGPAVRRVVALEAGTYAFRFRGGVSYSLLGCNTDVREEERAAPSNGDLPNEIDYPWFDGVQFDPTGVQVLDLTDGVYRVSAFGIQSAALEGDFSIRRVDWSFEEDPPADSSD